MFTAEIIETLFYGCISRPSLMHHNYKQLRHTQHLLICHGFNEYKQNHAYHVTCYRDSLVRTVSENMELLTKRYILFAGFVAGTENTKRRILFVGLVAGMEKGVFQNIKSLGG